ncbi:O-antigen ligase family protein [Candidatus Peregrinibacteria bacterium]|jgi:oligosaccharide repeat unit polymerase|nr:O-antigen ligase family protein [Candidatus Peregrinibacteria bacterium]MBT4147676.1 O-antigen ligase family protein [Candidatus Peregrinibacteria bacterium]MBT4365955.1 O-antigen ligase family protein [Candidatus Peregrinibacteria bacterium]MBT4455804.1 O-antigen ligase family protein [Candidatus Peregrinibacteria bacterium]
MGKSRLTGYVDMGIFFCVAGILVLVPLTFWMGAYLPFELPKIFIFRLLLYLSALLVVLKFLWGSGIEVPGVFRRKEVWLSLVILCLIVGISSFSSDSFLMSVLGSYHRHQGLFSFAHYLLFFGVLSFGLNRERMKRALLFGVASFVVVLIYGLFQKAGMYFVNINVDEFLGRTFSTLGHPNFFGSYIVLMFFPVLGLCLNNRKRLALALGAIVLILALINLYFSGGRAAVVGLIAGLVIFVYSLSDLKKRFPFKKYVVAAMAVFILWISLFGRFSLNEENLRSVKTRMIMWPQVIEMVEDKPFFGYGPDTFPVAFAPYMNRDLLDVEKFNFIPDRAHNIFLQTFSDFGFLGGGLIVLMFMYWWSRAYFKLGDNILGKSLLASLFALGVSHFFGFSTTTHIVLITFFWAFIFKDLAGGGSVVKPRMGGVLKGLVFSLVVAFIGVFCLPNILVSSVYSDNEGFARLMSARNYAHESYSDFSYFDLAEAEFEEASKLMPLYPPVYFHMGRFYFNHDMYPQAISALEYYVSLAPLDFETEKYDKINSDYKTALEWLAEAYKKTQ